MAKTTNRDYCLKEAEISELHTKVDLLDRTVMGNGQEGLAITVPKLTQTVNKLDGTVEGLRKGVSGVMKFMENQEGEKSGKLAIRKRFQWIVGLLVAALLSVVGSLIYTIHLLSQHAG